ncbi:splicing factor U2af large subunit B isoform X2 [Physcomitrium patens]|uniref:Splicing factor U2af large subunit n=1 Tax=Physcomitrium patens TaxID=3218 RepID=A0A7I4CPT3_PHYPA|nr:splicing factor U2af large subunit B-like isoform X2 [Physcomitrium patens]|eukprot:XP_024365207.1 splicing factor U2af large subunit B-like isoform X2 [Physcomitrella patens]
MADGVGLFEDGDSPPPRSHTHSQADYGYDDHREHDRDRKREHHSRESGRDREKSREKERDRRHRDDRDRDRDRGDRVDRGDRGDRDRSERHRSHDRDRRSRDYGDRDRRHRHRSRSNTLSRSPSRDRRRSRSRSPSRDRRRKTSGFDMAPPGATVVAGAAIPGQIPGMPPAMPGVFPAMFPFGGTQATRHARRVYVGGLPPMANEQTIATYFSQVMAAVGGNTAGPGDAVVNVYINQEKKFAFVEMRTVEEASNAMALDGIIFEGVSVRVRRPSDYNPSMAATLGPSQPSPHLNLAAVGLTPGSAAGGADGPDRIFVGGLPYYLTEVQIKELLESFGPLRGFDLVKDRDTGNSKGYGFCVYQDPSVVDIACATLNGMKMDDKTLNVRRATASGQPKPDQANVLAHAQQQIAIQKLALQASGANAVALGGMSMFPMMAGMGNGFALETPTKVVALTEVVTPNQLEDDEEYQEIMEDMGTECGKYGTLVNCVIPRPRSGENVPGLGKVFLEYSDIAGASKAKASLHGRRFDENLVVAVYYPEDKFAAGDYGG